MDWNNDPKPTRVFPDPPSSRQSYPLSAKLMLSAIIILFFVVVLMVFFHLYIRWYLRRAARRRRRNRRMLFFVDSSSADAVARGGLGDSVIKSLPVFMYSSSANCPEIPEECAVCLSEFEEGESGRVLPGCKHSFHVDCIDMWFQSHSTCPLCRLPVQPEKPVEVSITVPDPVTSGSALDSGSGEAGSPRRRPAPIKVPGSSMNTMEGESTRSDSPTSHRYRSPISRIISLGRMLSREGRTTPSPSPVARTTRTPSDSGESLTESDIELGIECTRPG